MPIQILMPALSPTMEKGNLAKWVKKPGDRVKSGDVIAEIETDKATMEVEAVDEGVVGKLLVAEGAEDVAVNTPIAILLTDGEDAATLEGAAAPAAQMKAGQSAPPAAAPDAAPVSPEVPAPPAVEVTRDESAAVPEVPAGTEMVTMTVREALRDAMAEEMRRDPDVFIIGEEVAEYQGAYKVSQGLLQEFGAAPGGRHPDHRARLRRPWRRRGDGGPEADRRVHDLQLRHAGDRPDHQFGGQDALHVRRADDARRSCSAAPTAPPPASPPSTARTIRLLVRPHPRPQGGPPFSAADAKGLLKAAIRDPNPVVFLENEILYGHSFPVPKLADFVLPIGKARVARPGKDCTLVSWGIGMTYALKAAEELAKKHIFVEVVDLRTLRPMDIDTVVASVRKTNRCVVVEEGWPQCGVAAEVGMRIMETAFDDLDAPVQAGAPARTCRCPTPPTWRSSLCPRCRTSSTPCGR